MEIVNHRFTNSKIHQVSCCKNRTPIVSYNAIILHYTASANAISAARHLTHPKKKVSAHMVIGRNATLYQLVPFNIQAWHAGISRYKNLINLNKYSIGLELDNAGKLSRINNLYVSWFGKIYQPEEVYIHNPGPNESYWHKYTQEQLKALTEICKALTDIYHINTILGHSDITSRKTDPGPAFPMEKIREQVFASS